MKEYKPIVSHTAAVGEPAVSYNYLAENKGFTEYSGQIMDMLLRQTPRIFRSNNGYAPPTNSSNQVDDYKQTVGELNGSHTHRCPCTKHSGNRYKGYGRKAEILPAEI